MSELLRADALTFSNKANGGWFRPKQNRFTLGPIDLTINKGETIAVIGENRAGKSLLAKLLVGALAPQSGAIWFEQKQFAGANFQVNQRKWAKNVRMIFQLSSDAMNPAIPVGKILDEPLALNTKLIEYERQYLIESVLLKVGLLREHYYFYRHMLSDGQQQRVAMARAIILNPQLLVADEPFAALDPSIRSQTVNLFLELQKDMGLSFVFISHNLGIVRHIADRIIVMDDGKIVETGETEGIFKCPQHDVTKKLIMAYETLANVKTIKR